MGDSGLALLTDVRLLSIEEFAALGSAEFVLATLPDRRLEAFSTDDDEFVVFAYTTTRNMVIACGGGQPSTHTNAAVVARCAKQVGTKVLFAVDAWHPAGRRYPEPGPLDFEPVGPAARVDPLTELWLPTRPVRTGAPNIQVDLFAVTPGQPMLLAYESPEELRACCGPYQDAVSIDPDDLDAVTRGTGAAGVLFGAVLSEDIRHQAPVLDWTAYDHFETDNCAQESASGAREP